MLYICGVFNAEPVETSMALSACADRATAIAAASFTGRSEGSNESAAARRRWTMPRLLRSSD